LVTSQALGVGEFAQLAAIHCHLTFFFSFMEREKKKVSKKEKKTRHSDSLF